MSAVPLYLSWLMGFDKLLHCGLRYEEHPLRPLLRKASVDVTGILSCRICRRRYGFRFSFFHKNLEASLAAAITTPSVCSNTIMISVTPTADGCTLLPQSFGHSVEEEEDDDRSSMTLPLSNVSSLHRGSVSSSKNCKLQISIFEIAHFFFSSSS